MQRPTAPLPNACSIVRKPCAKSTSWKLKPTTPWASTLDNWAMVHYRGLPREIKEFLSHKIRWCKMTAAKCSLQEFVVWGMLIVPMLIRQCLENLETWAQTCPNPCQSPVWDAQVEPFPATPMDQEISPYSCRVLLLTSATLLHQERSNDLLSLDLYGGAWCCS